MYVTLVSLPKVTSCHTPSPLVDPLFLWSKSFLMYGRYGLMEVNPQERYFTFTIFHILDGCLNYLGACPL
jgi:hypothetical protein